MRKISAVLAYPCLACLACVGHGWQEQTSVEQMHSSPFANKIHCRMQKVLQRAPSFLPSCVSQGSAVKADSKDTINQLQVLAMLLLALKWALAFNPSNPFVRFEGMEWLSVRGIPVVVMQASGHAGAKKSTHDASTARSGYRHHPPFVPRKKDVFELRQRSLGPEHPDTLKALDAYAGALDQYGRQDEAAPLKKLLFELSHRVFGSEHALTHKALVSYVDTLGVLGQNAEAEKVKKESCEKLCVCLAF